MTTQRRETLLDGVLTTYLDAGHGRPIVALHGVPTSSALFEPLLPFLDGYRVIAPDLLGQGGTGAPARGRLNYSAYAAHLASFLDTVPPEFDLLVHDLGGILGLDWAASHPARVRSIVVLSTTVTWSARVGLLVQGANLLLGAGLLRRALPWTLKRGRGLEPALANAWAAPWTRRRMLEGLDLFGPRHLARVRAGLDRLRVPVLLIWGENDDIFPLSRAHAIARLLPQAGLVTIPHCGHWAPLDAGEEVAAHLRAFLERTR